MRTDTVSEFVLKLKQFSLYTNDNKRLSISQASAPSLADLTKPHKRLLHTHCPYIH